MPEKTTGERHSELTGIGLAMAGAVAFGTMAIFAKEAYESGATAVPLLAGRFALTSILLIAYVLVSRGRLWLGAPKVVRLLLLGAFGYGVEATLFFMALERAPASVVGLVFYSYPLWTTLMAIALRMERFEKRLAAALIIGSIGVSSIFSLTDAPVAGLLLALGAAVMVAIFYLGAQVLSEGAPPTTTATWTAVGAALALGALTLFQGEGLPAEALGPAAALGVATTFAFIATFAAVARIGSSKTAIANMVELVTTIVLATLLLDEELTLRIAIGAVLVLSAIPILAAKKRDALPAADTA